MKRIEGREPIGQRPANHNCRCSLEFNGLPVIATIENDNQLTAVDLAEMHLGVVEAERIIEEER